MVSSPALARRDILKLPLLGSHGCQRAERKLIDMGWGNMAPPDFPVQTARSSLVESTVETSRLDKKTERSECPLLFGSLLRPERSRQANECFLRDLSSLPTCFHFMVGPSNRLGIPSRRDLLGFSSFFEVWGVSFVRHLFLQPFAAALFLRERDLCLWLSAGRDAPHIFYVD